MYGMERLCRDLICWWNNYVAILYSGETIKLKAKSCEKVTTAIMQRKRLWVRERDDSELFALLWVIE